MKNHVKQLLFAVLLFAGFCICGQAQAANETVPLAGGWETAAAETSVLPSDAQAAFDKAVKAQEDAVYTPVALLSSQVVAGTNYCVFCQVTGSGEPFWALVYIYEDLKGNAEITNVYDLDIPRHAAPSRPSPVVSYLGPEGTYTQEACGKFFDKRGSYEPYGTVREAVEAMLRGEADYAVIPQENTIGGAVSDYIDTVIGETAVSVAGGGELPITQNLLVRPGTELRSIRTVYSHKQGLVQGREWLEEHLPDADVIEVSSTAEGARMVSEADDGSCAAIASAASADIYGLEILAAGIQNNDSNITRFYVLTGNEPAAEPPKRLAFLAAGSAGDLPALMAEMERLDMKLVTIHDRPQKTKLGQYHYLIECTGCDEEDYRQLTEKCPFEFRFLGSFEIR